MVWDTGSDWIVVASSTCANCDGATYDHSSETSFKTLDSFGELFYGTAYAKGYHA